MPYTKSDVQRLQRPSYQRIEKVDSYPPYFLLKKKLANKTTRSPTTGVVHWFRNKDLRIEDNTALCEAYQKAQQANKLLLTVYLYCPNALIRQGISKARLDFMLETLNKIQSQLHKLYIPLVILSIHQLSDTSDVLNNFCKRHHISELHANYEYETDELERDIAFIDNTHISCFYYHDQCLVEPGSLLNRQKKPFRVFTPYYKQWLRYVQQSPSLISTYPPLKGQARNSLKAINGLLDSVIPSAPSEKAFSSKKEKAKQRRLWPSGHVAALKRLNYFIEHHLENYGHTRNQPALNSSSRMSPYLAIGAIGIRTVLKRLKQYNNKKCDFSLSGSSVGVSAWVREIVFREFYRQQLVITPHLSMNTPQQLRFTRVNWENDEAAWQKWCEGKTGVPWIDAGMRQLQGEGYMHNRLRMNVASYLYNTLLTDYRWGERYFAEMLIDLDLANNVQGWSPSYTVFNPVLQAEKNDPTGDYIRRWVPELQSVNGKAIFDPYHRLPRKEFNKLGYPKPCMNWKEGKKRAKARFREAVQ